MTGYAPGAGPDDQLRHLLAAAESVTDAIHDPRGIDVEELAGKADHLAACVAAVDAMCKAGDLPAAWRRPAGGGFTLYTGNAPVS